MDFIDTHIHLDHDEFANDLDEVIEASRRAGVRRWINVGYNEDRWSTSADLADRVDGMYVMLGLHPGNADDWDERLEERLRRKVSELNPVAIGEIGLDLYWRQDNLAQQERVFRAQLDIAGEAGLPAVIHMRDADSQLLDAMESMSALPHVHFHSFDGDDLLREWVLGHGATIGVGGLLTRRGSDSLQGWVAGSPRDIVVLETDAPYLKPRGLRGTRNEPAYILKTAKLLAELWHVDMDTVALQTTANAERIFGVGERR